MISSSSRTSKLRTSSGEGGANAGNNGGGEGSGGASRAAGTSSTPKKLKTTSLRPGGLGLGKGRGKLGSALRAKAKSKRHRGGANLKDQSGPRKVYSVQDLLRRRDDFGRAFPDTVLRIMGVTGLGLGLQDDLTQESWEEAESSRPAASTAAIERGGGAAPTPPAATATAGAVKAKGGAAAGGANIFGDGQQRKSDQPALATDKKRKTPAAGKGKANKEKAAAAAADGEATMPAKKEVTPSPDAAADAEAEAKPAAADKPPAEKDFSKSSANAWKPLSQRKSSPLELVKRKVRDILNKMTKANFASLTEQLVSYAQDNIKDSEQLGILVQLVYQYAIEYQNLVQVYAGLCMRLSKEVPSFEDPNNPKQDATFRFYLLSKCQYEFQNGIAKGPGHAPTAKEKQHMIGNINFVGELYKVDLLPEKIMHECIQYLVREPSPSEEDSEQLVNLMTRIGKKLDSGKKPKYLKWIDDYFQRFVRLSQTSSQSARAKFLFLDLIDLRKSKWVPKRERKGLKDIDPNAKNEDQGSDLRNPSSEPLTRDFPSSSALGGGAYKGSTKHGDDVMIDGSVDRYSRRRAKQPTATETPSAGDSAPSDNKPRAAQSFGLLPSKARPVRTRSPRGGKKATSSSTASSSAAPSKKSSKAAAIPRGDGKARPELIPQICEHLFGESPDIGAAEAKFRKFGREKDKEECVNKLFNLSLDKDDSARSLLPGFLARVVPPAAASPFLDGAVVMKVINGLFDPEEYDMMCLDYPKLSQYYAELVAHCLLNGVVEYGVLPSLVGKLREVTGRTHHDEKFLGQTLSVLNRDDVDAAKAALSSASVTIGSLLREGTALDTFLAEHKVGAFS